MSLARIAVPVTASLVLCLSLAGCAGFPATPPPDGPQVGSTTVTGLLPQAAGKDVCKTSNGRPDPQAPIVCIDRDNPTLNPKNVYVDSHVEQFPNVPVAIKWYLVNARQGDQLEIKTLKPGCIDPDPPRCPRPEHCISLTVRTIAVQTECAYEVWVTPTIKIDPVIVVNPCCGGGDN